MKPKIAAAALVAGLSICGVAVGAAGGRAPQQGVPEYDPRSPEYHNPASDDPKSPGYSKANNPPVEHTPDDEFACGYKFKDLPAFGYHPPNYVDDEGVGPAVISIEDAADGHGSCRLMTREQSQRQREYVRANGQAPSGQVAE